MANLGNAGAITGSVWVRGLRRNGLGLVECERVVHETTVAAIVLLGAINQLLLREGHQTASGHLPRALDTTSRRECLAGSALALSGGSKVNSRVLCLCRRIFTGKMRIFLSYHLKYTRECPLDPSNGP